MNVPSESERAESERADSEPAGWTRAAAAGRARLRRAGLSGALLAGVLPGLLPGVAAAEPRGGEVISGDATVTQTGNDTLIETTTHRTRMRWQGFDIAVDESVHVQQPNTRSTLVNQVNDASVTTIDGSLTSNGRVWILNPAGVYFGGTAIVEVAGLVAAAGAITDEAYVIGARHFHELQGDVVNHGEIRAGDGGVALIGRAVENHGQIVTQGGDLVLAAGDDVLLMGHDTYIQVRIRDLAGNDVARPEVLNTGLLDAGSGRAQLAAGDFLGLAIRNQGEIHAHTIAIEAGRDSAVQIAGHLDASSDEPGGRGGRIEVTADFVVVDDAVIEASGDAGGGEIRIGGEAGGRGSLAPARNILVGAGAQVSADAREAGDGGEIVVWGDEFARVEGRLSARGGAVSGDGGFIETSSHGHLAVDADVDVGAPAGHFGTWLLDPVNIDIVATITGTEITPEFDFDLLQTIAQPDGPTANSQVSTGALIAALERGGNVIVTTQESEGSTPGTEVGRIFVDDPIVIPDGSNVAPNSSALLSLLAAGDIEIDSDAEIATLEPDLELSVSLFANDNFLVAGSLGQPEPADQQRFGDVLIGANITTNGGDVSASGTNVVLDADIDTSRADPDAIGGAVDLRAVDVVETGQLPGDPTAPGFGDVTIMPGRSIRTGGGSFSSAGEGFSLLGDSLNPSSIDVYRLLPSFPDAGAGEIQIDFSKQVDLQGTLNAETIVVGSGSSGQGDLSLSADAVLSATSITLNAGDGPGGDGQGARVVIDPGAQLSAANDLGSAPERFFVTQDAPIHYTELPRRDQFGGDDITDMLYVLDSQDGDPDPMDFDIVVGDPLADPQFVDQFQDADLVLNAPDSIDVQAVLGARNLTLLIEEGFQVTAGLAANLTLGIQTDEDDGLLIIHAGRDGSGNLELLDGVHLEAPIVALRAGDTNFGSGSADDSAVIFADDVSFTTDAFEVRQDADLHSDGLPSADEFAVLDPTKRAGPEISGMELTLISDSGSVTIADPAKVADTKLTLAGIQDGDDDIVLEMPISVQTADVGGLAAFRVEAELLDQITLTGDEDGDRILTLRGVQGILDFGSRDVDGVAESLVVDADRIRLIGSQIDLSTNTPEFVAGAITAPRSFVFQQGAQVTDAALPDADNFPNGGPSELFAIQSLTDITLSQEGGPNATRKWSFPIADAAQVILNAPQVSLVRSDGLPLELGALDQLWGTNVSLTAFYNSGTSGFEPIVPAKVDADLVASIRGFDPNIDFSDDPGAIQAPDSETGRLTIDQDGSFDLLSDGLANDGLPDVLEPASGHQPDTYQLISRLGSIEVENDRFEDGANTDLRLELILESPDRFIDFEESDSLDVRILIAQVPGEFVVGKAAAGGTDGAIIGRDRGGAGSESVAFTSGSAGGAPLRFASGVEVTSEVLTLRAGDADGNAQSIVYARPSASNPMAVDPTFAVETFQILQGGDILNDLPGLAERLPAPSQFTLPLERYVLQSRGGIIEINEPSDVLIARTVEFFAGNQDGPTSFTLRADVDSPGEMRDLVLIGAGSSAEAVRINAGQIVLEAPGGYVDAGDPRVVLNALGSDPLIAIRQQTAVGTVVAGPDTDAERLPENRQLVGSDPGLAYVIQAVNGVELGETLAGRISGNELVLVAGVPDELFEAAEGSFRGDDPDPDFPDAVYDRLADLDHDGDVDPDDDTLRGLLGGSSVVIDDPDLAPGERFDLILASLSIQTTDAPIGLGSVHIQTLADQVYGDEVMLLGDTEMSALVDPLTRSAVETAFASSVTFEEEVYGSTAGGESLVVNATDRVHFMKDVGARDGGPGVGALRLGLLQINLEQLLQLQDIPPTPRVEFGTAPEDGQPAGSFRVVADTILLNPEAGNQASDFVRAQVPDRATFFSHGDSLSFELGDATTPGEFRMGRNEKLGIDGSTLRIDTNGGTVTVGDLSARDLVDVKAATIHINRRDKGFVQRANGEVLRDNGVDFVASRILFEFDGSTGPNAGRILHESQVGSGKDARFGIDDPANAPGFMRDFSVLALQYNILAGGEVPLDGVPDGVSRTELGRAFADVRPEVPIGIPAAQRIRNPDALETIGVRLREPTSAELRNAARGAVVFRDLDSMAAGDRATVVEARLVAEEVEETARLYHEIFGVGGERTPAIREVLQAVIDDYKRSTGARRVVGLELRRYVYNRPSSQFHAYQELQSLDALFRHHRRSGLTRAEYSGIQRRWLEAFQPEGITTRELSEFIHPSRYVRSRDVLDVFED